MPKKASPENRYPMQSFSISAKNADIIDILKKQENKTKFICEAIREKYNNDNATQLIESSEKLLEEKVQEILLRLYGDNITIIASNKSILSQGSSVIIEEPKQTVSKTEENKNNNANDLDDDDQERLKNIFQGW